jgi:hypothetical protein
MTMLKSPSPREWHALYVCERQRNAARHYRDAAALIAEAPDEVAAHQRLSARAAEFARISLIGLIYSD